jgi:hypothetical protein
MIFGFDWLTNCDNRVGADVILPIAFSIEVVFFKLLLCHLQSAVGATIQFNGVSSARLVTCNFELRVHFIWF